MYTAQQTMLANELAETLHDFHSITQYLRFTERYTEEQLRETLDRVMAMPAEKIKRSRGALFTHLIKNYDSNPEHFRNKSRHQDYRHGYDRQW